MLSEGELVARLERSRSALALAVPGRPIF